MFFVIFCSCNKNEGFCMSEKFCIFCGQKPKNKNLEHVIPQWLIKMAGVEKKPIYSPHPQLGRDISFMQFSFPACTECNSKFAKMEGLVKPVLERVLSGQSISGADASLLMDWFDKVRIGLWLSNMFYNPVLKHDVQPHYHIDFGVAKKDRMLSIQKLSMKASEAKGIYCGGTMTHLFNYCPVAFTMVINDYYFFNASTHNLVSPRVGFPKIIDAKSYDDEKGLLKISVVHNDHKKVVNPIVQNFTPGLDSITFYQPIYRDFLNTADFPANEYVLQHSCDAEYKRFLNQADSLVDEYMLQHSYDASKGLGGVYVQKGSSQKPKYTEQNERVNMKLKSVAIPNLETDVLKFQNTVQGKGIISSPEVSAGMRMNAMMLRFMQYQK